jgi:glucose-6-phosphate isomerase
MFLNPNTSSIEPFTVDFDLERGIMHNPVNHIKRHASDMLGHYKDATALERLIAEGNDPLHYEVFETPVPKEYGHLMYCISTLQPGLVGEECFMTKGHYHKKVETGEIYMCLRGVGYMMMKTEAGECRYEKMVKGSMVYVPPYWAHRSINIGTQEPLISFCVYLADCGYNYGDIEKEGFPKRVFNKNGRIVIE